MGSNGSRVMFAAAIAIALGLSGCGTVDNALFGNDQTEEAPAAAPSTMPGTLPGSSGPSASAGSETPAAAAPMPEASSSLGITPVSIAPGADTGTAVGKTIATLRGELSAMQGEIVSDANQLSDLKTSATRQTASYHQTKAEITTRLQIGTTRGNPNLVSRWNSAQSALDSLTGNINSLTTLAKHINDTSARAHNVLNTIRATYNVSGAVDEDYRQLTVLDDETRQTIVLIDRLVKSVAGDIQRETTYVATERNNLTMLEAAIKQGSLGDGSAAALPASYGAPSGSALVTIRFANANVRYRHQLYEAVSQALKARPDATFSVVGLSPTGGSAGAMQAAQSAAQRHARQVMRAMSDMGVPGARLSVSSATDPGVSSPEVRVYVH